jgi:hypothetical protein
MLIPIVELMERAYDKMPYNFTSNEFSKMLRELECPERMINKYQSKFLKQRCQNEGSLRTWRKESPLNIPMSEAKPKIRITEPEKLGLIRRLLKWIY